MAGTSQYQSFDMEGNEIKNVCGHNSNITPIDVKESQFWYDTVAKTFKFYDGTNVKEFGRVYSAGNGIVITNDQISVSDFNKILKNLATGEGSLNILGTDNSTLSSLLIGIGALLTSVAHSSVGVGHGISIASSGSVAIGNQAEIWSQSPDSTVLGNSAMSKAARGIAIGNGAVANRAAAIQIGPGTNSTTESLQIGFTMNDTNVVYMLLDGATGLIPDARLSDNIARINDLPTTAAEVNALPDSTSYGRSLDVSLDPTTYVLNIKLKDQSGATLSTQTVDFPIESLVVNGGYYDDVKKVILRLKNGNTIDIPLGDLIAGLQSEITSGNKLSADLIADGVTNAVVTQTDKINWNNKQDFISDLATIRAGAAAGATALQSISRNDIISLLGFEPCRKYSFYNPALTATGGQVTWTINNPITNERTQIGVHVYDALNKEVGCQITVGYSTIEIKMNADQDVSARSFVAVVMG